jgi:murein L,D-transpeptidase YcbB/YkuD
VISEALVDKLIERATKPGVMSLAGVAAEKQCANDLRIFFRKVAAQIRERLIVLHRTTDAAVARHTAELTLAGIMRRNQTHLQDILEQNISEAMLKADKQSVLHEAEKKPKITATSGTIDKVGLSAQDAADYASKRAAETVKGINKTTIQRFADAVSTAIEDQLGVGGLSRLLRDASDDLTKARADMIAATEMADAFGEASLLKMDREGIEYKQLIASPDACEICLSIIDNGPIPVDDEFEDDDGETYDRSPIHPNCRCATVGARNPEENDDA